MRLLFSGGRSHGKGKAAARGRFGLASVVLAGFTLLCGEAFSFGGGRVVSDPLCREAAAALAEAKKALDPGDFARLEKRVDESLAQGAAWRIGAGRSRTRAREEACAVAAGLVRTEIFDDWLRRHPEGVQGLWRLGEEGLEGVMSIFESGGPDRFRVTMQVNLTEPPYAAGLIEGFGTLKGRTLRVVSETCPDGPVTITFDGDTAVSAESGAFQSCGLAGLGATFSGRWRRERK